MEPTDSSFEDVLEPDGNAVVRRLAELGIPGDVLTESVRIGHNQGDFVTAAHPRTYQGVVVWGEVTASLRHRLSELGWTLDDEENIARVISPDGSVTVVAVSGNERTGLRNNHEKLNTRRPRGPAGVRIIKTNMQYELALDEEGVTRARNDLVDNLGGTWFLLYFREGDVVRSELSYAMAVAESGRLLRWKERLILPDIDLLGPEPEAVDDTPPDVDVPVSRRG